MHPKARNSATESALLAKGSLDFAFAYRNPYFTHVSRTSLCNRREREREKIKFARVTLAKKKKKILHPHSLLKGRALLRFEFETKTKRKQKKFSHASVIALAEALSPLFAKSSIIFVYVLCVFLFSLSFLFLFFLCAYFLLAPKKIFSLLFSLLLFFFVGGVEFLYEKIFENPKTKEKKGFQNSPKTSAHEVYINKRAFRYITHRE